MYSLFCRVLAFVFLLNCCVPANGWAQSVRRSSSGELNKQISAQVKQAQEDNSPAAQFIRADTLARQAHRARFAQADEQAILKKDSATTVKLTRDSLVQQPQSLYVAPRVQLPLTMPNQQAKDFLKKVARDEIAFEELVDYADPLDPDIAHNDLMTLTYAAEIIGNNVSQMAELDTSFYDVAQMQEFLVQIQARLIYRLSLLGYDTPSFVAREEKEPASAARTALQQAYPNSMEKTLAVGTLRTTLLKIHQFYKEKGLADPVEEYQKQRLANKYTPVVKRKTTSENDHYSLPAMEQDPVVIQQRVAKQVEQYGNLAHFQKRFIEELKQAKDAQPEPDSAEYQHLQVLAEYATKYVLEYKPDALKDIVKIFDDGVEHNWQGKVKAGKYHRTYSPILNAIFTTIFENTRYSNMDAADTKKVLELLTQFSDPQQYSLPTRVFALETASLLYRPFNQETLRQFNTKPAKTFLSLNFNKPDENLRKLFAARVADIYCPLTSSAYDSYGLSAKEMQALADQLAYIYDGFYDISTPTIHMPGQNPHQYPAQCNMVMKNQPNRAKKNAEDQATIFRFTADTIFWVYGGDVFKLLGTAFRLTRGAVAALPKAGKAARLANRGEKVAAFTNEVKQGAKFNNYVYKLKNRGYTVVAKVEKEVPGGVVQELGKTGSSSASMVVTQEKVITTTHALKNQYSLWNPKRWVGLKPDGKFSEISIIKNEPGLNTTVGTIEFKTPVDGLHSMQDIKNMWAQLPYSMRYTPKPYWQGILESNQTMVERSILDVLKKNLDKDLDVWVPLLKTPSNSAKIAGAVNGQTAAQTTRWWNYTRWGKPESYEITEGTRVFVAPTTRYSTIKAGKILQAEGGLLDAPSRLSGFFTSGTHVLNGTLDKEAFQAFFKPLNWQTRGITALVPLSQAGASVGKGYKYYRNLVAQTFLPDYLPTATFWKAIQANPALGVKLLPPLLWRNRFTATTLFFGAWVGADHLIFPFYKGWQEGQAVQDMNKEISKYGDTFSSQQAKMDELLLKSLGGDLSDQRAMNTYFNVLNNPSEEKDGTLMVAPIVGALHALGRLPFVGEGTKADYAIQAQRMDLNRALLRQQYTKLKASQQAMEEWKAKLHDDTTAEEEQVLTAYAAIFAAQPQLKEKLHQIYQTYEQQLPQAQTQEEQNQIIDTFTQQRDALIEQIYSMFLDAMGNEWYYDESYEDLWKSYLAQKAAREEAQKIVQAPEEWTELEIKSVKLMYKDLVTPAVETQFRALSQRYAQAAAAALEADSAEQIYQAQQDYKEQKELLIMQPLREQYLQQGYGADFDPDAGDDLLDLDTVSTGDLY